MPQNAPPVKPSLFCPAMPAGQAEFCKSMKIRAPHAGIIFGRLILTHTGRSEQSPA